MNAQSPAEVAANLLRLTGRKVSPDAVARNYREGARVLRQNAAKAAKSKTGTYRGYTEAQALTAASDQEARAISVPAELVKLLRR